MKPFIKWAGGKRWLAEHPDLHLPNYKGRYIEPFLGGGAMFFHLKPRKSVLADVNSKLISTYRTIALYPDEVKRKLQNYQRAHSRVFYYKERGTKRRSEIARAAQFLYLNRTCWNGLYRENLKGVFNVPIGTKSSIYDENEDFATYAALLSNSEIFCQDFELTIGMAGEGDFLFVDPPYTTAHNLNGFVKYNQKIFSWQDQERLYKSALSAKRRGATVCITNACHTSLQRLYKDAEDIKIINRRSVISGDPAGRRRTSELLIAL